MPFVQAVLSAASVGISCGAGCGSAASAFLTTYVLSEGKGLFASWRQVGSFYLGKMLAILMVCAAGAMIGQNFISSDGTLFGFPLKKLVYIMMLGASIWLLYGWLRERKSCKGCRHCGAHARLVPSLTVGLAYGFSPCSPMLMVLGYATLLSLPEAISLGVIFSICSSLIPALLTLALSGALSMRISGQLGKTLPWFQLAVYALYLISAVVGLLA